MSWFKKEHLSRLQIEIDHCHDELESLDPASPRYKEIVNNLNRLKLGDRENEKPRVSKDTVVTVATYAGLTVLVLVSEIFGHSITSRAMNIIPFKPRI